MAGKIILRLSKSPLLSLALLWVLLWLYPWTTWLESQPWLRLGVGLLIFTAPGMAISLLLAGKRFTVLVHLVSGLALSVLLVGILGLLGRVLHISFVFVKLAFALAGLISLWALSRRFRNENQLYKPQRFSIESLVMLSFMAALGVATSLTYRFGGDDFSYLAYLTTWQKSPSLNFSDVFFGLGNVGQIRFWLAMLPMGLALLAEISNIHGLLLLGFYLEPFFIVVAILASYNLYEDLLLSERQAVTALLLQFAFLFALRDPYQPGDSFFRRLSEDKAFAAFILGPVFFLAMRFCLDALTPRSGIYAILCGLSLSLTHPVILAYSIFIVGVYAGIVTIINNEFKKIVIVTAIMLLTILPSASLRFIDAPWISRYIFSQESPLRRPGVFDLETAQDTGLIRNRISSVEGTPFYGFNLKVVKFRTGTIGQESPFRVFLSWSYLWILGLGFFWSLFNLRRNAAAPFIAATSLLVILCAIPHTGWLVGYVVSARMLWRAPWLLPTGLIGVILLADLFKVAAYRIFTRALPKALVERSAFSAISVLGIFLIGYYSAYVYGADWRELAKLDSYKDKLVRYSALGDFLENNIERPAIFVADSKFMNYLPGLSSKSKVVFFRNSRFSRRPVDMDKIALIFSHDASISINQRMNILKRNHIQYILLAEDTSIRNYYVGYPQFFDLQSFDNFWIIEFRNVDP
jgi:hypothetical protein